MSRAVGENHPNYLAQRRRVWKLIKRFGLSKGHAVMVLIILKYAGVTRAVALARQFGKNVVEKQVWR